MVKTEEQTKPCRCGCGKLLPRNYEYRNRRYHDECRHKVKEKRRLHNVERHKKERETIKANKEKSVETGRPKMCRKCWNLKDNRPLTGCVKCGLPFGKYV